MRRAISSSRLIATSRSASSSTRLTAMIARQPTRMVKPNGSSSGPRERQLRHPAQVVGHRGQRHGHHSDTHGADVMGMRQPGTQDPGQHTDEEAQSR